MMITNIRKQVSNLLANDNSGHNMDHINRVLNLSLDFAQKEKANQELTSIIALLHDVDDYKLFGQSNQENLYNAKRILEDTNLGKNEKEIIYNSIKSIGYSKRIKGIEPIALEGKIVSDADMCDAIGANGILRVYAFGETKKRPFFNKDAFPKENIQYSNYIEKCADSSVCHFFEKLLKLKNLMFTNAGYEEAIKRHQFMIDFLYQFFEEERAYDWIEYLKNFEKNDKNIKQLKMD